MNENKFRHKKGFTLIEVLLSIALVALIAGISVPVYQTFNYRNELDVTASLAARSLKTAQVYSRSVNGDSNWGISFQPGMITLFKGNDFSSRDTSADVLYDIPKNIKLSGANEVEFQKFTGELTQDQTVTFTNAINENRTVTVNTKGIVNY